MIRFLTPSAIGIALATCWFVLSASPTIAQQTLPEAGTAAYAQDTDNRQDDNAQGNSAYYPNAPRRLVVGQPELFYNFYANPYRNGPSAAMYPAPRPVPPLVGHTYSTYQPFMPHEFLYPHLRVYHFNHGGTHFNPYVGTRGNLTNKTTVVWQRGFMRQGQLPVGKLRPIFYHGNYRFGYGGYGQRGYGQCGCQYCRSAAVVGRQANASTSNE